MKILLVEDDPLLGDTMRESFQAEGYAVDWLTDGVAVLSALVTGGYDLVVLDNRLPTLSGMEVLKAIREKGLTIPVLMLTVCASLNDKVIGLDAGADDYLTKPFEMDELFARIRSLLRRQGEKSPTLSAGPVVMHIATREVFHDNTLVEGMTPKEFSILEILLRNKGRFMTKHRLLECCTSWDGDITLNTIEVYISRLRKRFGPELIETLRRVGYRVKV